MTFSGLAAPLTVPGPRDKPFLCRDAFALLCFSASSTRLTNSQSTYIRIRGTKTRAATLSGMEIHLRQKAAQEHVARRQPHTTLGVVGAQLGEAAKTRDACMHAWLAASGRT